MSTMQRRARPQGQSRHGCITCKIRKVKCDEGKPVCTRCTVGGFKCDGYESNFRSQTLVAPSRALVVEPNIQEVLRLARDFTIRPLPRGTEYEPEARITLSVVREPAVRHALAALTTLRPNFQERYTITIQRGLAEYTNALGALSGVLPVASTRSSAPLALLCCQLFISIELAMQDFYSAVQHFIQGLRIMQQYGPRSEGMPNLDLFILKLCLSCPGTLSTCPVSRGETHVVSDPVPPPAGYHEVRLRLEAIAASTNNHIKRRIEQPTSTALDRERSSLLEDLQQWNTESEALRYVEEQQKPIDILFIRLIYLILKVTLLMSTSSSMVPSQSLDLDFSEMLSVGHALTKLRRLK